MSSFEQVAAGTRELEGFPHPWFVCGGWAIDLFVGKVTREHEDLEIGVFRHHQQDLKPFFDGWGLFNVSGWLPWEEGEWLELPIHQILVRPEGSGPGKDWDPSPDEIHLLTAPQRAWLKEALAIVHPEDAWLEEL